MTKRPCKACQKRRKLLEAKLLAKQAKGKKVQAAAIGAVLTTTALVGRLIGEEDGQMARETDSGEAGTEPCPTGSREGDRGQAGPELDDWRTD